MVCEMGKNVGDMWEESDFSPNLESNEGRCDSLSDTCCVIVCNVFKNGFSGVVEASDGDKSRKMEIYEKV